MVYVMSGSLLASRYIYIKCNYRWTINLALKTAEKMFYAETPFAAEDLVEVRFEDIIITFSFSKL
jgi:hypothetical protein